MHSLHYSFIAIIFSTILGCLLALLCTASISSQKNRNSKIQKGCIFTQIFFSNLKKISRTKSKQEVYPALGCCPCHETFELHTLQFFVHKILCMQNSFRWMLVHKENHTHKRTDTLLIMWYSGTKCTKSLLKPLVAKNNFSFSVLCTAPFLQIILFHYFAWS